MIRTKITTLLLFLLVSLMSGVYFFLPMTLEQEVLETSAHSLEVAANYLEQIERLEDFSVVAKAQEIASFDLLRTALVEQYTENFAYQRHLNVYEKGVLRWKYAFKSLERDYSDIDDLSLALSKRRPFHPELVFVTDEAGVGIAALGKNKYSWWGENIAQAHKTLMEVARTKQAKEAIWLWRWSPTDNPNMYHVGVAPVMHGDLVIGLVVVGNLINDGTASQKSAALDGRNIAYFHSQNIYVSTLSASKHASLAEQIFGESSLLDSSMLPQPIEITLDGEIYTAVVRYYRHLRDTGKPPENVQEPTPQSGYIVLNPLNDDLHMVKKIERSIPIFGVLLLITIVGTVLLGFTWFIKPFEEIDRGIGEILAGNKDYIFTQGNNAPATDLARSLNMMSAFLQGKPMPDEEEEDTAWEDFLVTEVTQTSVMKAIGQSKEKAEQDDVEYHKKMQQLFDAFIKAKENLGEDVSEFEYDGFARRMEQNLVKLKTKHNAKDIAFKVVVRDGKVAIKPHPIF